ncbi:hypothetical protein NPX13_g11302 [Xylaria arbuscula]|uniref:Uncharacterized protein n=1 Tax=Xylaria arbuscula TaxID=114810 RepID=A0A9W8TFR6_9PEZI|nr:hypothetical protein NPX13_g11302 [Xylaria arbuscula]
MVQCQPNILLSDDITEALLRRINKAAARAIDSGLLDERLRLINQIALDQNHVMEDLTTTAPPTQAPRTVPTQSTQSNRFYPANIAA